MQGLQSAKATGQAVLQAKAVRSDDGGLPVGSSMFSGGPESLSSSCGKVASFYNVPPRFQDHADVCRQHRHQERQREEDQQPPGLHGSGDRRGRAAAVLRDDAQGVGEVQERPAVVQDQPKAGEQGV